MAIKKEWHCDSCEINFESAVNLCKKCGGLSRRVFLTAPQISTRGVSKRIDGMLERNFQKRGISNYSNTGGGSKISWKDDWKSFDVTDRPQRQFMENDWRSGGWGKDHLGRINADMGTSFNAPSLSGPKVKETTVPPDKPQKTGWQGLVPTQTINKK